MHAKSFVKYNVRKPNAWRGKVDGLSNVTVRCVGVDHGVDQDAVGLSNVTIRHGGVDQDAAKGGTYFHSSICPTPGLKSHKNNLLQPQSHNRSSSNHVMVQSPDERPCHCHQPSDGASSLAMAAVVSAQTKSRHLNVLAEQFIAAEVQNVHTQSISKPKVTLHVEVAGTKTNFEVHISEAVLAITSKTTTSVGDGTSHYVKGTSKWPTGRPGDHYRGGKWEGEWHCSEGWGKSQVFIQSDGGKNKVSLRLDQKSWYAFHINPSSEHAAK